MKRRRLASLWTAPVLLALATIIGLLSALLGDDQWDVLSWLLLGVPLAVCAWFGVVRRTARRGPVRTSDP